MKVLLLTPSVRPLGARRSLVELVRALPSDVTPLVVCPSTDGIALELKNLGIDTAIVPQGAWRKLFGRMKAVFWQVPQLRSVMDRFRPDVCHANEFHIVPQVLSANGGKYPVSGHIRLSIASNQIVTYGISGCGTIVAVSKAVASLLNGSGLESRVRVVYNGVDVGHFSPDGPPAAILGSGGENVGSRIRFGLFGLVNERKNQLLAVEALSRVVGRGIDAYLLLAGDAHSSSPAYAERLRARIAQPDLAGRVTWLPFQSDVPALYRSIDVNLLPSQMEGFGRTIIEASALRRPSIGARVGGIPEVIEDGRTGWLVEAGDVEGLAAIMADLAAKPGLIQSAGEAALARTETVFGIKAHAARMIEVWNETIASHKAGAH